MSISFVQQKTEQSTSSVSSFTTSSMTVTAGNTLVAASACNLGAPSTQAITDSVGDVFTTQVSTDYVPWQRMQLDLASNAVGGSTTFTVTLTGGPAFLSLAVKEYAGVAASAVEATAQGFSGNALVAPPPLSPPSAGDLYLSAWTHNGSVSQSFTPNSGWTLRSNLTNTANMPLGSEEFIGSGTQTGLATLSSSASWDVATLALRAGDVAAPDPNAALQFIGVVFPNASRGF